MKKYFLLTLLGGMTMQGMASGNLVRDEVPNYFDMSKWEHGCSYPGPGNLEYVGDYLGKAPPPIKAFDVLEPEQYASVCDRSTGVFEELKKTIPDLEWRDVDDQQVIRSDEPLVFKNLVLNGYKLSVRISPLIMY